MKKMSAVKKSIITAVCIALCVVLPQVFHAIPEAGTIYCPMHIPVLLCGLITGWPYGLLCGLAGPLLAHHRHASRRDPPRDDGRVRGIRCAHRRDDAACAHEEGLCRPLYQSHRCNARRQGHCRACQGVDLLRRTVHHGGVGRGMLCQEPSGHHCASGGHSVRRVCAHARQTHPVQILSGFVSIDLARVPR